MPYTDFTLDTITTTLGVSVEPAEISPPLSPALVPEWLGEMLARGTRRIPLSEKARSEFIVVPVLLACQELGPEPRTGLRALKPGPAVEPPIPA